MGLRTAARLFALGCAALTGGAAAQINLPPVRLPPLPGTGLAGQIGQTAGDAAGLGPAALTSLRRTAGQNLIRQNRQLIEADPKGEPMLRGQLVALDLSPATLERTAAAGFVRVREQRLEGLDSRVDVLQAPPGMSTRRARSNREPAVSQRRITVNGIESTLLPQAPKDLEDHYQSWSIPSARRR